MEPYIIEILHGWTDILSSNLTVDEKKLLIDLLVKMSQNVISQFAPCPEKTKKTGNLVT